VFLTMKLSGRWFLDHNGFAFRPVDEHMIDFPNTILCTRQKGFGVLLLGEPKGFVLGFCEDDYAAENSSEVGVLLMPGLDAEEF